MTLDSTAIARLYSERIGIYDAFIRFFRSRNGFRRVLERSGVIRPGMRVLDAGCGFGTATFALLDAMRERGIEHARIDAFDLTPAMLARFAEELRARPIPRIELRQADVLDQAALPPGWQHYDLVLSASMLEYLPEPDLPRALALLRARMAAGGRIVVMITRRSPETKLLIDWAWHANRYTQDAVRQAFAQAGFENARFVRFPLRYAWLNRANFVVVAETPPAAAQPHATGLAG